MAPTNDKQRKREAREIFEEADNAGRFAGDDQDAQNARREGESRISREEGNSDRGTGAGLTDNDSGDSQNVADDNTQNLGEDLDHARNKATEGQRQQRD